MFESNGKSVKVQKILLYGVKYHNNYITYRKENVEEKNVTLYVKRVNLCKVIQNRISRPPSAFSA